MPITNKYGLSTPWIRIAEQNLYDKVGWRSATELVGPVRLAMLRDRHREHIEVDVCDMSHAILGEAVHTLLERAGDDAITEQRFIIDVMGKEVSMKPDRFEPEAEHLRDFKTAKVWAYVLGTKDEWVRQTNIYAHGLRQHGHTVSEISIELLIKDWDYKGPLGQTTIPKNEYPESPIIRIPVDVWLDADVEDYLRDRVMLFMDLEDTPDNELPICTMEERWGRPDKWAVKKKGGKRALSGGANFETEQDALDFAVTKNHPCDIEFRPGKSTRCEHFCDAKMFCNYYLNHINPAF